MVKYYDTIPRALFKWIYDQKVFWVATAPMSDGGLINLSPKGLEDSFHIVDDSRVWYEDLTGSGVATIAHVRENGRITILFNAFEGPPMIVRIYGKATVYEFGTPEYLELLPVEKRKCGSRSVIMIDVVKVATSCGWGVPIYTYRCQRNRLYNDAKSFEMGDILGPVSEEEFVNGSGSNPRKGMKYYWRTKNTYNVDGLPALQSSYDSEVPFCLPAQDWPPDDESIRPHPSEPTAAGEKRLTGVRETEVKIVLAFIAGALAATSYLKLLKGMAL